MKDNGEGLYDRPGPGYYGEPLEPEDWRDGLGFAIDGPKAFDELDQRVREDGPKAFPYLKEVAESDKADDQFRYRAMAWMVKLYQDPDVDKEAIVDTLQNIVHSALESSAWSQPRKDALMALARLRENPWEDTAPNALNYLLQLAKNTNLRDYVSGDVLRALADTGSEMAVEPLATGILNGHSELVQGMRKIAAVKWDKKATTFIELVRKHPFRSRDIDAGAVVHALSPSWEESPIRWSSAIKDFIIEQSRNTDDERVAGVLAKLLVESEGGDQIAAGHRINEYQKDYKIPTDELEQLRSAVGGTPALTPLMGVLKEDLETYFQKPIFELNKRTTESWIDSVKYATLGVTTRLCLSVIVFGVGIILLLSSSARLLFFNNQDSFDWSTFVTFISGLGTMLLMTYTAPLKEIRQAVIDLATASAAFIGYVHRVLETSHTFSFYYMQEKLSFEELQKSSAIIQDAMKNTIQEIKSVARDSSEGTITKALNRLEQIPKQILPAGGKEKSAGAAAELSEKT